MAVWQGCVIIQTTPKNLNYKVSTLYSGVLPPVNISALILAESIVGDCEMKVMRKLRYKLLPGNWMNFLKLLSRCITRVFWVSWNWCLMSAVRVAVE